MTRIAFTGERLHEGSRLFGVDLARHRAAYHFALQSASGRRLLELGCGSGYGTIELEESASFVVGVDRITPDAEARGGGVSYLRADLSGIPLASGSFDMIVSFQVIEHLEDPTFYLNEIGRLMRPNGTALITTPNILTSDGVNPFHVHEYRADELGELLRRHFGDVEMKGVGQSPEVASYQQARLRRIRRIMRLDPLRLRERLPRAWIEWLFGRMALLVRRGIAQSEGLPDASWRDFPVGAADAECLDLLAVCRGARSP